MIVVICLVLITGSTFSLFGSNSGGDISVSSGKVDVVAVIDDANIKTWSLGQTVEEANTDGTFANEGSYARYNAETKTLELANLVAGDNAQVTINVTNNSSISIAYRIIITADGELYDELNTSITVGGEELGLIGGVSVWSFVNDPNGAIDPIVITLGLDEDSNAQDLSCTISFAVEAVQGNASLENPADTWDGTVDVEWYDEEAEEFVLNTAEQLAGLAALIDGDAAMLADVDGDMANLPVTFEGKTIVLNSDVDLYMENENGDPICFDPIGSYRHEKAFSGIFDGNGHTIKNLNQNTWELDNGYYYGDLGLGFFGAVENAYIKNLTFDGVSISGESAICGVVAGTSFGETVFENITIKNAECADYQYYAGGIVGWASGNQSFINCTIDSTTTIAAQWGDFDNSIGGVIGGCGGSSEILLKDCVISCRIDAYSDATSAYQWFAYRRAGMLIGNTGKTETVTTEDGGSRTVAIAPQLTCENVTVIYEDWANYHYCEFGDMGYPYVRVEAGVSNSGYSNPRYGHPTDANGNEVVDDNHVHYEGEDHLMIVEFDQLFGGGQGVYGNPVFEGVTVIYNNK